MDRWTNRRVGLAYLSALTGMALVPAESLAAETAPDAATITANAAIAERFVKEVCNGGNGATWVELIAPDYQPEDPGDVPGADALWDRMGDWITTKRDAYGLTFTIAHVSGDATGALLRGDLVGEMDGRKVRIPYFFDFAISDGVIEGLWQADAMWDD